jgi:3-oxoacyl-(acyl-carrier-protein) synthase
VVQQNVQRRVRYAMTNSFGFGGNNATLVFGQAHD